MAKASTQALAHEEGFQRLRELAESTLAWHPKFYGDREHAQALLKRALQRWCTAHEALLENEIAQQAPLEEYLQVRRAAFLYHLAKKRTDEALLGRVLFTLDALTAAQEQLALLENLRSEKVAHLLKGHSREQVQRLLYEVVAYFTEAAYQALTEPSWIASPEHQLSLAYEGRGASLERHELLPDVEHRLLYEELLKFYGEGRLKLSEASVTYRCKAEERLLAATQVKPTREQAHGQLSQLTVDFEAVNYVLGSFFKLDRLTGHPDDVLHSFTRPRPLATMDKLLTGYFFKQEQQPVVFTGSLLAAHEMVQKLFSLLQAQAGPELLFQTQLESFLQSVGVAWEVQAAHEDFRVPMGLVKLALGNPAPLAHYSLALKLLQPHIEQHPSSVREEYGELLVKLEVLQLMAAAPGASSPKV